MMRWILILVAVFSSLWAPPGWSQSQVGIPFREQKGFILELRSAERRLILDLGENQLTAGAAEMEIAPDATILGPKGVAADLAALRPGLEIAVAGERLGSRLVIKTIQLLTEIADDKVKVSGVYERLDGPVATIGGQLVVLGEGVRVKGMQEWKGMTFASFGDMMLGSFVELEGKRGADGQTHATKAETWPNVFTAAEGELLGGFRQSLALPPANQLSGGRVAIGGQEYRLVQDLELQAYVTRVGYKLIPDYVQERPEDDPSRITFRFYVIEDPSFNACAYPDGSVFVHTGLLAILDNEAQLAAVLGHEIAHVTHEHGRQQYQAGKKIATGKKVVNIAGSILERMGKGNPLGRRATVAGQSVGVEEVINFGTGLFSNVYSRQMEDQADQVGLFYMHEAGYDPREAPKVWRKIVDQTASKNRIEQAAEKVQTFLYSSHPAAQARLSHLNREIALYWHATDFDDTVTGEESYRKVVRKGAQ